MAWTDQGLVTDHLTEKLIMNILMLHPYEIS